MRLERHMSAEFLFLCGALSLPAFLFGESVSAKVFLSFAYLALSALAGRRVRVLPNVVVAAGIIGANLVMPFGRIFFRVGGFPVTEGAFRVGLLKAATVIGLIYLSRLTIRSSLRLPGRTGEVFSLMLFYFERITARRVRLDRKNLWESIDLLLRETYSMDAAADGLVSVQRTGITGWLFAACFLGLNWGVFLLDRLA